MMLFLIKTIIKYILLPIGMIHALFFRAKDEILILMYHRVDGRVKKELSVSIRNFNWHMNYLSRKGYSVISMDEAYTMISKRNIKGRHIVITFDDGYKDYYTNAYPILRRQNFPSIIYLCPCYIGTNKRYWWDHDEEHIELMEWEDINRLNQEGLVLFGSHTLNHADMDQLSPIEVQKELVESQKILEKELGKSIRHFSYPTGIYSRVGEELLKEYYDTGVLISKGKRVDRKCSNHDVYTLKRIPILKSDGKYLFVARIRGWLIVEELIRKHLLS